MREPEIPATPAALAASLAFMAGGILEGIEKTEKQIGKAKIARPSKSSALREAMGACYCLPITVLSEHELAAQSNLWNLYTAATYRELKNLGPERNSSVNTDEFIEQAVRTYLHDSPDLAELAKELPAFSLGMLIEKAAETEDWFCTFMTKAHIRITAALGVAKNDPLHLALWYSTSTALLTCVDAFRQMQPVFTE